MDDQKKRWFLSATAFLNRRKLFPSVFNWICKRAKQYSEAMFSPAIHCRG